MMHIVSSIGRYTVESCVCYAAGRDLMRPNMSAGLGPTCLSTLIAAPTFPRTVPRHAASNTLQRHSRTPAVDNGLLDPVVPPATYHQRKQLSQTSVDGPLRSTTASSARQTQKLHNTTADDDRSVHSRGISRGEGVGKGTYLQFLERGT